MKCGPAGPPGSSCSPTPSCDAAADCPSPVQKPLGPRVDPTRGRSRLQPPISPGPQCPPGRPQPIIETAPPNSEPGLSRVMESPPGSCAVGAAAKEGSEPGPEEDQAGVQLRPGLDAYRGAPTCSTSEEDSAELVIPLDEGEEQSRGRKKRTLVKRKRQQKEEEPVTCHVDQELDRALEDGAKQHNLTAVNVRNILHEVITNEHVVAMMKAAITETEGLPMFEPKMTRSKLKEVVEKGV
ncbi:GON-4-like protein, partial [Bufo gargarizans]|uniref:GON-4-like protein n=1 Tax=Bufo gargarizans TaxID=30331 RepID=UPI001CF243D6